MIVFALVWHSCTLSPFGSVCFGMAFSHTVAIRFCIAFSHTIAVWQRSHLNSNLVEYTVALLQRPLLSSILHTVVCWLRSLLDSFLSHCRFMAAFAFVYYSLTLSLYGLSHTIALWQRSLLDIILTHYRLLAAFDLYSILTLSPFGVLPCLCFFGYLLDCSLAIRILDVVVGVEVGVITNIRFVEIQKLILITTHSILITPTDF